MSGSYDDSDISAHRDEYGPRARYWNWVLQALLARHPEALPRTVAMLRAESGGIARGIQLKLSVLVCQDPGVAIEAARNELRLAQELAEL